MTRPGARFRLHSIGIVTFAILAIGVFLYFLNLSGVALLPGPSYEIRALVPNAVTLADHADVLEAGVRVGAVTGIAAAGPASGQTMLTLQLSRRYGPVYRDAQIRIRSKSLAGENYVDLNPGSPAAGGLPNGATLTTIPPEATQLDQILSTFDRRHRQDLQSLLDSLGTGLGGHGADLNSFLGASADLVDQTTPVAAVLAHDRTQVASLIANFGTVAGALGQRAADIQQLVRAMRIAGTAVAARNGYLRQALAALPRFLAQARTSVGNLGQFSNAAVPVLANLRLATAGLIPGVRELRPASRAGRAVLADLTPFAHAAQQTMDRLRTFAPAASALLGPLESTLRQANPLFAYLAPYSLDFGSVFQSMRAPTHFRDGSAGYGRVAAIASNNVLSGVSPAEDKLILGLEQAHLLTPLAIKQYNAYPRPGTATHPVPFSGPYPRIQEDPPYRLHA